jgi:predicted ester cyclase
LGLTGVNSGASGDMPATGKSINVDGYDCIRIADGKVIEYWTLANEMKMMTQLGLMPEMGEGE